MKIDSIEIEDFRAFPGPGISTFNLAGKNLLIYGENGSGKSSLFTGLSEFFNLDRKAKPFSDYKNIFSDPSLDDGHITVHFDDNTSGAWSFSGLRPLDNPRLAEAALRFRGIDYRALLRTHFIHSGNMVNLFQLAVSSLLAHYPVPTTGGRQTTIGKLWRAVANAKPRTHHKCNLDRAFSAANEFNRAFEPVLPSLTEKTHELLAKFPGCDFELEFAFPKVMYDVDTRKYAQTELNLIVTMDGKPIEGHQHFLNEARLSALALALYFAGLLVSIPPAPAGTDYPQILVLDDAVIGLDMSNRMPVLAILQEYFSGWQTILMTYDKVWYEMVRLRTQEGGKWRYSELFCGKSPDGLDLPVYRDEGEGWPAFLVRARQHLLNNDDRAAVAYARAAFEGRIKNYCEKKKLCVRYASSPEKMKSEWLWTAIKEKAKADGKTADYQKTFTDIETNRKIILNPLSHFDPVAVTRNEIESAINAIEALTSLK